MYRRVWLVIVFAVALSMLASACSAFEDGQTYWRRVIYEEYGVTVPTDTSIVDLIDLHEYLREHGTRVDTDRAEVPASTPKPVPVPTESDRSKSDDLSLLLAVAAALSKPVPAVEPVRSLTYNYVPESTTTYLGRLSSNPYDSESVSNTYGRYGSPYGNTLSNPYSTYASPYSSRSWSNPYTHDAPKLYASDGRYLGKLSSNPYDPESVSNPYGKYGNPYSSYSINNPYGQYGSEFSNKSWNNPYTYNAPRVYGQ